ncbi:MAG: hypothetical protein R3D80_07370 [Paracoccaceae bacterium]
MLAILGHAAVLAIVVMHLVTGPAEARKVTPVFHLTFVGLIVSPIPALQLGWHGYATVIFWAALVAAMVIWALSALQFARETPPPPLRPLLAIHLAPASLLGTVAMLLGYPGLGLTFGIAAIVLLAALRRRALDHHRQVLALLGRLHLPARGLLLADDDPRGRRLRQDLPHPRRPRAGGGDLLHPLDRGEGRADVAQGRARGENQRRGRLIRAGAGGSPDSPEYLDQDEREGQVRGGSVAWSFFGRLARIVS